MPATSWISVGFSPAITSSKSMIFGSSASARATSSRRRSLSVSTPASTPARGPSPTRSSTAAARRAATETRRWCRNAPTIAFSSVVNDVSVCEIWKVRPKPSTARRFGRQPTDVPPIQRDRTGAGDQLAGQQVEQRRLAGAVRADDADDLARCHRRNSRHPPPAARRTVLTRRGPPAPRSCAQPPRPRLLQGADDAMFQEQCRQDQHRPQHADGQRPVPGRPAWRATSSPAGSPAARRAWGRRSVPSPPISATSANFTPKSNRDSRDAGSAVRTDIMNSPPPIPVSAALTAMPASLVRSTSMPAALAAGLVVAHRL